MKTIINNTAPTNTSTKKTKRSIEKCGIEVDEKHYTKLKLAFWKNETENQFKPSSKYLRKRTTMMNAIERFKQQRTEVPTKMKTLLTFGGTSIDWHN